MPRILLLTAFALSGITALAVEILWTRIAGTWFGASAHAIATVSSAWMAGLALGSWVGGQAAARWPTRPIRSYAIAEVGVAVAVLLSYPLLGVLGPLLSRVPDQHAWGILIRFIVLTLAMLPATAAMGATFPLFAQAYATRTTRSDVAASTAYSVNLAGAALGCIGAAYVLLPGIGVRWSLVLLAATSLAAAGLAVQVRERRGGIAVETSGRARPEPFVMVLAALGGFAVMADEVLWSRIFRQAFGLLAPFQGFALVLTGILAGMALGSLAVRLSRPNRRRTLELLVACQGGLALLSIFALAEVRMGVLEWQPWVSLQVGNTLALAIPAMLAGCSFPLVTGLLPVGTPSTGRWLGTIAAASTLGGVAGSFGAGFVLLPTLGIRLSVLAVAVAHALAASVAASRLHPHGRFVGLPIALALLAAAVGTGDRADFVHPPSFELAWTRDGVEATTAVLQERMSGTTLLYSNGAQIGTRGQDRRVTVPMEMVPLATRVLLIGFGTGTSSKLLLDSFPDIQLSVIEIDGHQFELAAWFGTEAVLANPRFSYEVGDARQYLRRIDEKFDLVILDAFGQDLNQELYSVEFFQAATGALAPDGVFFAKLVQDAVTHAEPADVLVRTAAAGFPAASLVYLGTHLEGIAGQRSRTGGPGPELWPGGATVVPIDSAMLSRTGSSRVNSDDRPYYFSGPEEKSDAQPRAWSHLLSAMQ